MTTDDLRPIGSVRDARMRASLTCRTTLPAMVTSATTPTQHTKADRSALATLDLEALRPTKLCLKFQQSARSAPTA